MYEIHIDEMNINNKEFNRKYLRADPEELQNGAARHSDDPQHMITPDRWRNRENKELVIRLPCNVHSATMLLVGRVILSEESVEPVTVASYRRRHQLAEEVPGLYIRRLTLEDPRSAREPSSSRSQSPTRHICHPTAGYVPSSRRSSSYRSWLERIRKDRPPFLTIVSLELPECPIPLIESQANSRSKSDETSESAESKDDVLDELLGKVTANSDRRKKESDSGRKRSSRKSRSGRKRGEELVECTKGVPTLEECTKNIVEGPNRRRLPDLDLRNIADCICSDILENCRTNVSRESESRETRSPSPEMTHIIRIAMNYHDQLNCGIKENEELGEREKSRPGIGKKDAQVKKEVFKEDDCCDDVNDALDFTLNCCSVQLTSRGTSAKTGAGGGTQQGSETRTYSARVFHKSFYP
ncbi:uncharacterized protein LOC116430988 [Nomia melanderi]|uniref:uncharacterized protein LOC116430988 n=1 Tax=Nomia melanderi TaxID=2448451 RepID=UPI003FCC6B2B